MAAWQQFKLRQSASISNIPESVFSNWFQINSLPSHIKFSRFKASQKAIELAFSEFQSPVAQYERLALSFAEAATLQMETPDIPLERAYCVPLAQFLDGQATDGPQVARRDARNMATGLLRKAWDQFALSQGLLLCEFAHGSAWFVPLNLIEGTLPLFKMKTVKNGDAGWLAEARQDLDSGDGVVFRGAVGPWYSEKLKEYQGLRYFPSDASPTIAWRKTSLTNSGTFFRACLDSWTR